MATLYWDPTASLGTQLGGAGTWDTASTQWYDPLTNTDVAWNSASGDTAVFSGAAGAVTVSPGISAGEVDFTTSAYALQGGSLAIIGSGTIDVAAGLTDTIGSSLNGSNGLSITDSGTLVVSGANTFTGDTSIATGTLQLGNDSALSSGSVSVGSGATLDLNGSNPTIAGLSGSGTITNSAPPAEDLDSLSDETIPSSTLTVGAGDVSSTFGGTLQDGRGGINLTKIGAGTLTLSGANSYSGVTTVSVGILLAGATDALSASSAYDVDGTLDLGGSDQIVGSLWGAGTVQSTGPANVTLATGSDGSGSLFSGVIQDGASSGSLSLEATGPGTTSLSGTNTYTGGTTVDAGATLQLGDGTANNGSVAGDIADGGTVQFANATAQTFSGSITGGGGLSVSGPGTLTIDTSIAATGEVTVSAGATLQAGAANVLDPSSLIDVGGTFDLNGYDQTIDGLSGESGAQVTLGSATLTIDGSDNGSTTFSGVISGAGNLHKLGTDTLVLTAANTYTGQTIIDDGAIVLGENNHGILNSPTDGSGPVNTVDLTYDFTNIGATTAGAGTATGGLDGTGDTFSSDLLGDSQTWNGNTFTFGAADTYNAIIASGQDVDLASVPLSQVEILATAVGGNQTAQTFTVNYTDGTSATYTQDMSGWTSSQGYTGESVALTMAYSNQADGSANDQPANIYGYTFAVDPTKSVASITLPDNANVVVLAIDTVAPADTVTDLNVAPTSPGTIHLSWTEPSGTVAGYNVFRGQSSGGELTLLNSSPLTATTTTFDDTTVAPGNQYYYVVQAVSPTNSGPSVETDLSTSFNLTGIASDGTTFSGGLDGGGEALSGTLLGSSQTWNGQSFTLGAADQPDVVKAAGQTIALSPGYYASLDLLMTATNGNQPAQTFTVNYADGTSTTFTQGISDWYSPQGYSGESVAVTMAYRNNADGTEDGRTFHVYGYQFDLDSGKAVASITLPSNGNVLLLAATAEMAGPLSNETSAATPTTGATAQADLSSAFNHPGIMADGATYTNGGLDGGGNTFSGAQLGTSQTWNGASFIIGPAGTRDAVQAAGQTVALPNGQYSQLDLLMTATNGNQADQTFTVNYSDGTSATFTRSASDWFTPQGYSGESVAVATPYRNVSNGTTDNRTFNLYGYTFDIDSSRTVVSVTLPTNSNLFLFAATEHVQNILPTGGSVEINGDGLLSLNGTDQTIGSLSGSGGTVSLDGATLTTGGDNTSTTYAGTIAGAGNVVKTGSGTFTLAVASDYTGRTTVAAGTLQAGADNVFDPEADYLLDSILDVAGFSESIGSLAGNGVVTNSGSSLATLTTGGDNASTTFSGSLQDGASAQLALNKAGTGNFTLSGISDFSGPTEIASGTLEVDNSELATMVTLDAGATLQGNGGVLGVVNLGGTEVEYFYAVSIVTPSLQTGSTADMSTGSIALRPGETGLVLAMSEMDATIRELLGSATNTVTGISYSTDNQTNLVNGVEPSRPAFVYKENFSAPGVAYTGQALALEDLDGLSYSDYDYNDDYFQISVTRNYTAPVAKDDAFNDGVGGVLTKDASSGLLANDSSQSSAPLTVASVNGSTDTTIATAHGTLTWSADGSFTYTPNPGFFGTDTFTYLATDGTTQSTRATVNINVLLPDISLVNAGTDPVLVSDDADNPTSGADSDHLDQVNIAIDPSSVFASLPYNLTGWKLNLDALDGDGSVVEFWDSLGKANQLDNSGTGDETWTFTGPTISSGSVPTSIWTDVNAAGTDTLELAFVAPSSSTDTSTTPKQDVKVTGQAGILTAETIDDSGLTGGSPSVTGDLQHGAVAYVPVDNEDQYYVEDGHTLVANMDQSSVASDWALLPFKVHVASPNDGAYYLNFSDNIKIFTTPNVDPENTVISGATEINNLLDSNGDATFYIEGITQGNVAITLNASGQIDPLDTLNVTVFAFQGPQNVPNYSDYSYGVTGLSDGNGETRWFFPSANGGATITNVTGSNQVDIKWGTGGFDQRQAVFEASPYYSWDYYVNVVSVEITSDNRLGAFTITTNPNNSVVQFQNQTSNLWLDSVTAALSVRLGAGNPDLGLPIHWQAFAVTTGPHGNWGVDQILLGFNQVVESVNYTATYENGNLSSSLNSSTPLNDTGLGLIPGQGLWYPQADNTPVTRSSSVVRLLQTDDDPQTTIPAYYTRNSGDPQNPPNLPGLQLQSVSLSIGFKTYITAGVYDPAAGDYDPATGQQSAAASRPFNGVYTILALAPSISGSDQSWNWTTSGAFDAAFNYHPTTAMLKAPTSAGWNTLMSGTTIDTTLGQGNLFFENASWIPG